MAQPLTTRDWLWLSVMQRRAGPEDGSSSASPRPAEISGSKSFAQTKNPNPLRKP
jgi:hypothetical protein